MKYIVSGSLIVDRVMPHGEQKLIRTAPGGGAAYALSALKLYTDDCHIAAYSGRDFSQYYGQWMERNGFSAQGIVEKFEKTNCSDLYYLENGTHTMGAGNPDYMSGGDLPDITLLKPFLQNDPSQLAVHLLSADQSALFEELAPYRRAGLKVGYEMDPEGEFSDIRSYISRVTESCVDFFSLSYEEVKQIYPEIDSLERAIELMRGFKCTVFLRAGEGGAYAICGDRLCHSEMIDYFGSVDPTGCGNSSTAAAFFAFCEGLDLKEQAYMGAVAASLNAGSMGLVSEISDSIREDCARLLHRYLSK